ncbi:MAG: response regulator [Bdellovibrionales bacterium]|nr:response regulator [Bdellovibrionales bacterium]
MTQTSIPSNLRVAVIDEDLMVRVMIKRMFNKFGVTSVTETNDANRVLKKIENGLIDIVFTEMHLPKMSGLDLLRSVRSYENLRKLPIIICTKETREDSVRDAMKLGVTDYIIKPLTQRTIEDKLSGWLASGKPAEKEQDPLLR